MNYQFSEKFSSKKNKNNLVGLIKQFTFDRLVKSFSLIKQINQTVK